MINGYSAYVPARDMRARRRGRWRGGSADGGDAAVVVGNRLSRLNLTKLDVLNQLDEIKIGVAYEIDNQRLPSFPADLEILGRVNVVYETHPGWKTEIKHCRTFAELPAQAQAYVRRIEALVGVPGTRACVATAHARAGGADRARRGVHRPRRRRGPVRWIGVGPERDAMVTV